MDFLDSIGSFLGRNIGTIAATAAGGYGIYQQGKQRDAYQAQLQAEEDAANAAAASSGGGSSGGGGGGGGSAKAAAKEAMALREKYLAMIEKTLQPYVQAGTDSLPHMRDAYNNAADSTKALTQMLMRPEMIAKMNQGIPAYQVNIPLPKGPTK